RDRFHDRQALVLGHRRVRGSGRERAEGECATGEGECESAELGCPLRRHLTTSLLMTSGSSVLTYASGPASVTTYSFLPCTSEHSTAALSDFAPTGTYANRMHRQGLPAMSRGASPAMIRLARSPYSAS